MSRRELRRVEVLSRVQAGELQRADAAELVGVSYRQGGSDCGGGIGKKGRKDGNVGRESNRAKPRKFREHVLRWVRRKYGGEAGKRFGPTLAAEHREQEDGLQVDAATLRRWRLAAGLRSRERRRHFGERVQRDGSFHAGLEDRGAALCLLNRVDDATGETRSQWHEQETIWAAASGSNARLRSRPVGELRKVQTAGLSSAPTAHGASTS